MAKRKVFTSPSTVGLKKWATGQHVNDLQIFLQRFGYLQETLRNSDFAALRDTSVPPATRGVFDETTEIALRSYQKFHGLPVTGELDQLTVFQMRKPRCGFPDLPVDTGLSRFVLHRNRWDRRDLTYKIANPTGDLHQQDIRDALREAFALWSATVPLRFAEITAGRADITVRFAVGAHGDNDPFDGVGNVLAHPFFPSPNMSDLASDAHFDDAEDWTDIDLVPC